MKFGLASKRYYYWVRCRHVFQHNAFIMDAERLFVYRHIDQGKLLSSNQSKNRSRIYERKYNSHAQ